MGKYKVNDAVKRNLQTKFEEVVNGYLLELCNMWELDAKGYGDWVANEIGGTWCYGDSLFIDYDNIRYCVNNNVTYSTYMDWLDYCVWAADFGQSVPNLQSWCKGCPRVDIATQEKLSKMRYDLIKMCEEENEKLKNGKHNSF